jgi:outer membrane protein assembly factor BamB
MLRRLALLMLVTLALPVGCVKHFYMKKADYQKPSSWPLYRNDPAADGVQSGDGFHGRLDTVWIQRGEKPSGPLTIQNGLLILPSARKRLKFYDVVDGKYRGQIKLPVQPQTALLIQDSIGFVALAPPRNSLYGIKLGNQKTLWKTPVKDAPPGSILVSNRLIIGSADGTLSALNPSDGKLNWRFHVDERFSAAPSYSDGKLYQPSEKGIVHVLSETEGKELYQVSVKGPIVSAATVAGDVFCGDVLGNLYCLDQHDGAIRWQVALDGPIWTTPTVAGNLVIVGHSGGDLVALDQTSGHQVWKYSPVEVIKASPIVVGDYVIVGTMRGTLCIINAADGSLVARAQLKSAIAAAPVSDGRNIFVVTQDGRILCLGERHEQSRQSSH